MRESTGHTVQAVSGILAAVIITVAAISTQPTGSNEVNILVGSAFTLIAAIVGVHYGIRVKRNGDYK